VVTTGSADPAAPPAPGAAAPAPRTDQSPGRRTRRRLRAIPRPVLVSVTAVLVALAGTLAGFTLTSGGEPSHHATGSLLPEWATSGRILAQDAEGTLVLVDPATDRVIGPAGLGVPSGEVVMAAPDRRYVTTLQGDLLAVTADGALDHTSAPRITQALLGGPGTFAAHDQAVIVVASGDQQLRTGAISALILNDRRSVALGTADEAAGDPQAVGAFVSVARPGSSSRVPAGGYLGLPDSQVERRDAGQPPARLATAAQLNEALRQPAGRAVHLSVFPNPAGTAVAVVLNPPLGGARNVGIVVLDRGGSVIGIVPPPIGPLEYTWPSWSPDGRSLAYPTVRAEGTSLAIWQEGGRLLIRTAPDNGAAFGYCLWAPDGSAILCPTSQAARANWDQGAAGGGRLFAAQAPGTPVAWLPPGTAAKPVNHPTRFGLGMRRVLRP
jgi:hypothetical protein